MVNLARSFREVVRKLAFNTSVDQLKRSGVDRVNVLGMDRIEFLIQESVKRSLRFRLLALDREEVASATKEEFLRLLKSNEDLERQHDELQKLKAEAEAQVDHLRRDLMEQERLLGEKLQLAESVASARYYDAEDRAIAQRLGVLVEGLAHAGENGQLRDRILDLVMQIVREQRREAIEAREAVRDREVDTLRRRIDKLNENLQDTEHRLTEVTAMRHIDDGISSLYKEVQGLDSADRDYEPKKALMTDIFEANLRLQHKKIENSNGWETTDD